MMRLKYKFLEKFSGFYQEISEDLGVLDYIFLLVSMDGGYEGGDL